MDGIQKDKFMLLLSIEKIKREAKELKEGSCL